MAHTTLNTLLPRLLLLAFLTLPSFCYAAESDKGKSDAALIKKINTEVAILDTKIKNGELEHLDVAYAPGNTEGIPPGFSFYYEYKDNKFILRACLIPVGHETWSKHFHYYFDSEGKPIKYLETVKGRPDKPAPLAAIYGAKSEVIWKNIDTLRMSPAEVTDIFNRLNKSLEVFMHY